MNTAFIFPGQGSQFVGMGRDLYNNFHIAKDIFHEVNDILSEKLTDIMFHGPEETLTLTKYAQLAIMVVSVTTAKILEYQIGKKCYQIANYAAGHSLGEYSALCIVDSISFVEITKMLKVRANAMHLAASNCDGGMVACLGVSLTELEPVIKRCAAEGICEIANNNIEGQIIISGHMKAMVLAMDILKAQGKKAVKLNVSGPFHSSLMASATKKLKQVVEKADVKTPKIPVIANYTADVVTTPAAIKNCLINQVQGTVKWKETLDLLQQKNITHLVEIGPGKVLTNMAKKGKYLFECININCIQEIDKFLNYIK